MGTGWSGNGLCQFISYLKNYSSLPNLQRVVLCEKKVTYNVIRNLYYHNHSYQIFLENADKDGFAGNPMKY